MSGHGAGGYERNDVYLGGIVRFAVGLALGLLVSLLLMQGLLQLYGIGSRRAARAIPPLTRAAGGELRPPPPVLQGAPGSRFPLEDPVREMETLRREQRAKLSGGPVPIDEAKRRLIEQGLAVRGGSGGMR